MNIKKLATTIFSISLLSSCSNIIDALDSGETSVKGLKKDKLEIVFSHNNNGETHPCGCRHFPLGGLPQIAGQLETLKKDADVLYVDTGDTLFISSKIPDSIRQSSIYNAEQVASAMDKIGLDYFVPGDQDFAAGVEFLANISKNSKFTFLISNIRDESIIKHKKWVVLKKGPHKIYLTGLVFPDTIAFQHQKDLLSPTKSLNKVMSEITKDGFDTKNEFHRLIVLSHGGIDNDEALAKKFPQIEWIIGAHSQSFTRLPIKEAKKTKIVQVLSRNHYLGNITIALDKGRKGDSFQIHEMREERAKGLSPNPWFEFIDTHKSNLTKVQQKEQEATSFQVEGIVKHNTAASCISCHDDQASHWQDSAHSIAYMTLVQAKEQNNLACVKCHALGTSTAKGFSKASDIIVTEKEIEGTISDKETAKLLKMKEDYWNVLRKDFKDVKSIRDLSAKKIRKLSNKWLKLDEKSKISHNFANVQCLNCHDKHQDHPFITGEAVLSKDQKYEAIKGKCLSCHNSDQSPAWYEQDKKGLPTKLNLKKFNKIYDQLACPKKKEEE